MKEYPSWACTYAMLDEHGIFRHISQEARKIEVMWSFHAFTVWVIFPKLINIGWGDSVSKHKLISDSIIRMLRHEPPQEIGICI